MIQVAGATICFDAFSDTDFVHTFQNLPSTGIRYIEFNAWFPGNLTPQKLRDIKLRCERTGLSPAVLHGSGFGGDLTKDVCHKLRMIDAAKALGIRRISATGAKRGTEGGLGHIISVLKEIAPYAEEEDVLICLENHAGNNLEFIEDYEEILAAVPSSHVGVCLDDGHFDASDVDLGLLIDRLGPKINHIHVKENRGKGKVDFVCFGEGNTDHETVIRRLAAIGYEGFVTIEISPRKERPTTVEDMSHANTVINDIIRETLKHE